MKLSKIIAKTGEWLGGDGPHRQIVVTSRVRLARNLKGKPFPGWAKKAERIEVLKAAKAAVMQLSMMEDAFSENLEALSPLEKQVLVERHLDQSRACRQGRRQRGGHECRAKSELHDQRGGSSADAGDLLAVSSSEKSSP